MTRHGTGVDMSLSSGHLGPRENVRLWGFVSVEKVKASVDEQLGWDSFSLPLTLESSCYSWQSSVSFLMSAWVGEHQPP